MTMTEMTVGEARARKYAALAERYRLNAEVKVEEKPAEYWDNGDLMYPASVIASVSIREDCLFGDYLTYAWRSVLPSQDRKATTRGLPGIKIRGAAVKRKSVVKFGNEADFRRALSSYEYREDSPYNVLRRVRYRQEHGQDLEGFRPEELAVVEQLIESGKIVRDGDGYRVTVKLY